MGSACLHSTRQLQCAYKCSSVPFLLSSRVFKILQVLSVTQSMLSITQDASSILLQSKTHIAHDSAFFQEASTHKLTQGLGMSTRVLFMTVQMQTHLDPNPPEGTEQLAGCLNEEIVLSGKEEKNQGHTQRHALAIRESC